MADSTIKIGTIVWNSGPYGYYKYGRDFSDAARTIVPEADKFTVVPYFLECQAIELGLKAFLQLKGLTTSELQQKFGHNLAKLMKRAQGVELAAHANLKSAEETAIYIGTTFYDSGKASRKRMQYFDIGMALTAYKGLPKLADLASAADKLVRNDELEKLYLA